MLLFSHISKTIATLPLIRPVVSMPPVRPLHHLSITEELPMASPHRNGRAAVFTFDHDALELLPLLAPGKRAQGRFLSDLIRQEQIRRETRREMIAEMQAATLGSAVHVK